MEGTETLSPAMMDFARLAARSSCPVLLNGETGSGKTYLAKLIHHLSSRSRGPLVRVNCAAIPEGLFEGEMFGHVRGAFTDAREARAGVFEAATGGTLFLDELGELPLHVQPKLLTVLEESTVRRLGSTRSIPVDVRIVAASNCGLAAMVADRRFRGDLYYRCAVLEFTVPPLRARADEIPRIARYLLARISPPGRSLRLSDEAAEALCGYSWPGNIRELENLLHQAVAVVRGDVVRGADLPPRLKGWAPADLAGALASSARSRRYSPPATQHQEMHQIHEALLAEGGNKTRAAERLGMSRTTLWTKLQRYLREAGEPVASLAEPDGEVPSRRGAVPSAAARVPPHTHGAVS